MNLELIYKIRSNPALYQYLKYNSYWYKELYRHPNSLKRMEQEMKKEYKLTMEDKIEKLNNRLNMVTSFLEVLR